MESANMHFTFEMNPPTTSLKRPHDGTSESPSPNTKRIKQSDSTTKSGCESLPTALTAISSLPKMVFAISSTPQPVYKLDQSKNRLRPAPAESTLWFMVEQWLKDVQAREEAQANAASVGTTTTQPALNTTEEDKAATKEAARVHKNLKKKEKRQEIKVARKAAEAVAEEAKKHAVAQKSNRQPTQKHKPTSPSPRRVSDGVGTGKLSEHTVIEEVPLPRWRRKEETEENAVLNKHTRDKTNTAFPLLKNMPAPQQNDYSEFARLKRFAQSHSQKAFDWRMCDAHRNLILQRSNAYGLERLHHVGNHWPDKWTFKALQKVQGGNLPYTLEQLMEAKEYARREEQQDVEWVTADIPRIIALLRAKDQVTGA